MNAPGAAERWREIKEVLADALARDPEGQRALHDHVRPNDLALAAAESVFAPVPVAGRLEPAELPAKAAVVLSAAELRRPYGSSAVGP